MAYDNLTPTIYEALETEHDQCLHYNDLLAEIETLTGQTRQEITGESFWFGDWIYEEINDYV